MPLARIPSASRACASALPSSGCWPAPGTAWVLKGGFALELGLIPRPHHQGIDVDWTLDEEDAIRLLIDALRWSSTIASSSLLNGIGRRRSAAAERSQSQRPAQSAGRRSTVGSTTSRFLEPEGRPRSSSCRGRRGRSACPPSVDGLPGGFTRPRHARRAGAPEVHAVGIIDPAVDAAMAATNEISDEERRMDAAAAAPAGTAAWHRSSRPCLGCRRQRRHRAPAHSSLPSSLLPSVSSNRSPVSRRAGRSKRAARTPVAH